MKEFHVPERVATAVENLLSAYDKYRIAHANLRRASAQSYREGVPESVLDAVDEAAAQIHAALGMLPKDDRHFSEPSVLVKLG